MSKSQEITTKIEEIEEKSKLNGLDEVLNSLQLYVKAQKNRENKFSNFKYRSGEDIIEGVKGELKKSHYPKNCVILTEPSFEVINNRFFVCVKVTLKVGEERIESKGYAEHEISKKGMDQAQLTGSTCTYARKYALQNLFAIDDSEDDIDAKDNTKEGAKKEPTYGKNFAKAAEGAGEDMQLILREQNEKDFRELKVSLEECGSIEEIEGISESNKKTINKLAKYAPDLFKKLKQSKEAMVTLLNPDNEVLRDIKQEIEANTMQAG